MANGKGSPNDTYRGQLVDAYLQRVGSFRKLFTALLGFTAAFGFLIAWPYLSTVQQEQRIAADISRLDAELADINRLQQRYQQPRQAVQRLQQMIEDGPPMLRAYIESVGAGLPFPYPDSSPACRRFMDPAEAQGGLPLQVPNMPAQLQQSIMPMQLQQSAPAQPDSCAASSGDERLVCRIDRFVQFQLCEYEQLFGERVLPALAALHDGGTALFDQAELKQQFSAVREALHRHVAATPTFWHTYQGKGDMGVKLQDEVEKLWAAIAARMAPVIKDLDQRIGTARERRAALKADSAALLKQRGELTTRLTRIQSPVGNLPIGLTEAVLLFPVVLAIGFGMATAGLLEQLRLRRALRDAEQADNGGGILSSAELAQLAPLWIEPASPGLQRLAHWLLLLVPLLAFLGTVITVLRTSSGQRASLLQQAVASDWTYWLLYIASGVAFGICLWLMGRSVRGLARPD